MSKHWRVKQNLERTLGGQWQYVQPSKWMRRGEKPLWVVRTPLGCFLRNNPYDNWEKTRPAEQFMRPPITLEERRRIMLDRQAKVVRMRDHGATFGEIAAELNALSPSSMTGEGRSISSKRARDIYLRATREA